MSFFFGEPNKRNYIFVLQHIMYVHKIDIGHMYTVTCIIGFQNKIQSFSERQWNVEEGGVFKEIKICMKYNNIVKCPNDPFSLTSYLLTYFTLFEMSLTYYM